MTADPRHPSQLIWATRGRTWGFRFLLDAGLADPLLTYERTFAGQAETPTLCHRTGSDVALRLRDPLGRRDAAGRLIPHEFVLIGELAVSVSSVDDGVEKIWPLVEGVYAQVWDAGAAPSRQDLRFDY